MEDNIVIKKLDDTGFWEINKELLRDAFTRYSIKVEVNSSSFDDLESRREDSIAFFNTLIQGAQVGVPINFKEAMLEVIDTFEKKDPERFIQQQTPQPQIPQGGEQIKGEEQKSSEAAMLTEDVAKGGLTTGI